MECRLSDLFKKGIGTVGDTLVFNGEKFIVADLDKNKSIVKAYKNTRKHDHVRSIIVANAEIGVFKFWESDIEKLLHACEDYQEDKDAPEKFSMNGNNYITRGQTSKHYICVREDGGSGEVFVEKNLASDYIEPEDTDAKDVYVIDGMSNTAGKLYKVLEIYEEDDDRYRDFVLVIGMFIGLYRQNQPYFDCYVSSYQKARNWAFTKVMKDLKGMPLEEVLSDNRLTRKNEFVNHEVPGEIYHLTRIRKSDLGKVKLDGKCAYGDIREKAENYALTEEDRRNSDLIKKVWGLAAAAN